jgi:predicted ATPase/class 3 adenylate cyclase
MIWQHVRPALPSGTITFLFTDVEGSTRLLHELGAERYAEALAEHRRVIREACGAGGGVEVDTQGDAFFFAFPTASGATDAARAMTETLASGPIQVRIGLHTGTPLVTEEGYVGDDVHFAARVAASGHGGQVILSQATAQLVELEVTDLGEHRLKDIAEPVPIFQLGERSFPPLKTISNTNLPRAASSFVGREQEVADVVARIEQGARLVTLSGPGGSGKTRLALEAASALVPEYKAGVFWVGLSQLRDPALVSETICQTLGAKDGLAGHIGERELLLLLDNLEQVIEAAPELSALLSACPNLTLLVTSRELLRVQGEVEYAVPPLAEPEAVALFCERSQLPPSEEIAELCARLDSLPLALELAAARTRALSVSQILERLAQRLDLFRGGRDADPRQQTLRATIAWSYELLSPHEQRLFRALSVFAGGWTLEAAEEVAEADLDSLQSLIEKSLLRFTPSDAGSRYWMLETIREYASERLEASGETEELRRRHAEHFVALAEEAHPNLPLDPREWVERLEHEHDNFRAALDWLEATGEDERTQQLAGALWPFWYMKGHVAEGGRRLETAIRSDGRRTVARARALNGATAMALERGDTVVARPWAEEALELYRALGDAWGIANAVLLLGSVHAAERDFSLAQQLFEDALRRFSELGDEHYILLATRLVAWMCYDQGDRDRARTLHEDVVRRARVSGNERMQATSLGALAEYAINDGRVSEALPMLNESTRIYRDFGDRHSVAINVCRFARAAAEAGKGEAAARILSAAEVLREEISVSWSYWVVEMNDATLATIRAQLDEAARAEAWDQGQALTPEEAVELALDSLD